MKFSLNLDCVHTVFKISEMIHFLVLFTCVSASVPLWEILTKCLKLPLEGFPSRRRLSKAGSIKIQVVEVIKIPVIKYSNSGSCIEMKNIYRFALFLNGINFVTH